MLPHLHDRPLTMIRMPEGIDGERFFQKHWEQTLPDFVETVTVFSGHKDEKHDYILANNLPTLLWLGQIGTLEFHVWHSRAKVEPDAASKQHRLRQLARERSRLRCSTIPTTWCSTSIRTSIPARKPKGAEPELNKKGFAVGRRVAFWLHDTAEARWRSRRSSRPPARPACTCSCRSSAPSRSTRPGRSAKWSGRHLMNAHPREITMEWAVVKRTGKIFIDYNMNVRGKTLERRLFAPGRAGRPGLHATDLGGARSGRTDGLHHA